METVTYVRKPFTVEAVQVTEANIDQVAAWCSGEIRITAPPKGSRAPELKYIKVNVHRALNDRQTKAYVGDWVLFAGTGFKVYTPKAFEKSFELDAGFNTGDPNQGELELNSPVDQETVAHAVALATRP